MLARRVAVAAWRLARADRIEAELFEERQVAHGGLGLALIRDGNGARSFETLLRYRGAAMAEFWRALRTLKALQAEQAAMELQEAVPAPVRPQPPRPAARAQMAHRAEPNEPERCPDSPPERRLEYVLPDRPAPALHEPAATWTPNEPEPASAIPPALTLPAAHGSERHVVRSPACSHHRPRAAARPRKRLTGDRVDDDRAGSPVKGRRSRPSTSGPGPRAAVRSPDCRDRSQPHPD